MAENTTEKSRDQQINDLATRVAQEFKTLKGQSVDTSAFVPKAGDRGVLKGWTHEDTVPYEYAGPGESGNSIYADSPDAMVFPSDADLTELYLQGDHYNDPDYGSAGLKPFWIKTIRFEKVPSWTFGSDCIWVDGEAPTIEVGDFLIILFTGGTYFLKLLKKNAS